ncbi:hypothetical protein ACIBHY_53980 [Nonomuraea sp. NPDC050547]|uniref:hypothetical protein n=1 Tax=Nonomuraea sp. NPDC050547 TaxID=3364368 RepID=UPI00378F8A70
MENTERATRAADAVAIYARTHYTGASAQDGTDFELVARDLMSDLFHALDARGIDAGEAVAGAYGRYAEEDDTELIRQINSSGHRARGVRYILEHLAAQLTAYDKAGEAANDLTKPYGQRENADIELVEKAHDAVSAADDLAAALTALITAHDDQAARVETRQLRALLVEEVERFALREAAAAEVEDRAAFMELKNHADDAARDVVRTARRLTEQLASALDT